MVMLIVLNIILIIVVVFLMLYLIKDKGYNIKNVCKICDDDSDNEIKIYKHKQHNHHKPERVFDGRFITDEEYQQISESKRSDISVLLEEVNKEYEHLKELNK